MDVRQIVIAFYLQQGGLLNRAPGYRNVVDPRFGSRTSNALFYPWETQRLFLLVPSSVSVVVVLPERFANRTSQKVLCVCVDRHTLRGLIGSYA